MQLKLTRGALIGDTWREPGHVFEAEARQAEAFVKAGAAVPAALAEAVSGHGHGHGHGKPPEDAGDPHQGRAEKATAPRQHGK